MKWLFLLLVFACGPMSPDESNLLEWPERVVAWDQCLDIGMCPRFLPFARVLDDPIHDSVFWYISEEGHACVVPAGRERVMHSEGDMLTCHWRIPR